MSKCNAWNNGKNMYDTYKKYTLNFNSDFLSFDLIKFYNFDFQHKMFMQMADILKVAGPDFISEYTVFDF